MAEIVARAADKEELGRDVLTFRREDGVAENFHIDAESRTAGKAGRADRRPLLHARRTPRKLAEDISYSEAGITARETKDLWDMPMVFLLALLLRGSEWLLRRKWGVV